MSMTDEELKRLRKLGVSMTDEELKRLRKLGTAVAEGPMGTEEIDEVGEPCCRACHSGMHIPSDLEPSALCDTCAQEAAEALPKLLDALDAISSEASALLRVARAAKAFRDWDAIGALLSGDEPHAEDAQNDLRELDAALSEPHAGGVRRAPGMYRKRTP